LIFARLPRSAFLFTENKNKEDKGGGGKEEKKEIQERKERKETKESPPRISRSETRDVSISRQLLQRPARSDSEIVVQDQSTPAARADREKS